MSENVLPNSERWLNEKDLPNEIWKDYTYENKTYYQISNYGRLKSINRTRVLFNGVNAKIMGKLKKPIVNEKGYVIYSLSFDGKNKQEQAHRIVAECFLDKETFKCLPQEKNIDLSRLEINHKDENTLNNKVENLEWCTHLYNMNYGTRTKRVINATSKPIEQYDKQGRFIKEWSSLAEASEILKISRGTLCSALKGDIKSCGGYQWKYKDSNKIINIYTGSSLSKKVVQLDLDNNVLAIYDSLHDAERKTGVWMTQIKKCCDKIPMYNTAKGYKWCWESELNGQ